jgi:hypothetical protein
MAIWPRILELKLANAAQNCSTNDWWFVDHGIQHLGGVEVSFSQGDPVFCDNRQPVTHG